MRSFRHIFNVCVFIFTFALTHAQSEDELNTSATKLFEKEQYVEATSYYLRLISLHPKNPEYNFRYGTCLLYNSFQKEKAIRYLSFAITEPTIDPRAFYFHGKSLHLNFQFDDAIKSYRKYIEKRGSRDNRYNVEREIEMCQNGKKLLITFTDIIVSEKQEIDKEKFFRLYKNMETIGGDILVSAEFQSKLDKKKGHVPIVHFPPQAKAIYYSSYGEDGSTGLDIYIRRRLPDGTWGDPQILPGQVNSKDDEDFPYMHPSGDFLYFSSKGHNSMGGYDIFYSRYNPDENVFGKPENVDFAISSPDDDFFYVVDSEFKSAYFASARQSENGKLHVYNVRVARVPIQQVIVMGDFISEINPKNEKMHVRITQSSNGSEVGKIVSNEQGKYSFVFPKGGKYNYEITIEGKEDVYKYLVELPYLDEFRPLKQKAIHKMIEGEEIVTIVNLFDEKVEGAEALIAEVIRKKSSLDVNIENFDLNELEEQAERNKILADLGFNNMSIDEVSSQLSDIAKMEKEKAITIEKLEANLDLEVLSNAENLQQLETQLKKLLTDAENATNPIIKHNILLKAKSIEDELDKINSEITLITTMKEEILKNAGSPSTSGVGKMEVLENQYKSLISQEKEDEALALLTKNKTLIKKSRDESPEKFIQQLVDQSIALNENIKTLKKQQVEYELSESKLSSQINQLKNQLIEAKKKEADQIRVEIANKTSELELVKEVLDDTKRIIIAKNNELNTLNRTIASLKKAITNDDLVAYKKEDVQKVLNVVKSVESQVASSSIDEQIASLEESYPELSTMNVADVKEVDVKNISDIQSYQNKKFTEINSNSTISEEDKINAKLQVNNQSIVQIDRSLEQLEKDISTSPANSSDLLKEQKAFVEYKTKLEGENKALNDQLLNVKNTTTEAIDIVAIKKQLTKKLGDINSNTTLSKEEKINSKLKVNAESIAEIEKRLKALEPELSSTAGNLLDLLNEQAELTELKSKLERENQVMNQQLLPVKNLSDSIDIDAIRNKLGESTVIGGDVDAIRNKLNERILEIDSNSALTNEDKVNAKRKVNNEGIAAITMRLSHLERQMDNSQGDIMDVLKEQEELTAYKSILEGNNLDLKEQLFASKNLTKENDIASIQNQLNEKLAGIEGNNSLSEEEKINAKRKVNTESIAEINKRFNVLEEKLSSSPGNPVFLNEQTALMEYKSELEDENRTLNEQLLALQNPTTENNITSIQNQLNEKLAGIEGNNSLAEEEKINAKRKVNTESIAEINKRFNELEEKLGSSPGNPVFLNEQTALMEYKSELDDENRTLNEQLLDLQNPTAENDITSIQNQLNEKITSIDRNNSLSEEEKINAKRKVNTESIAALNKRFNELEEKLGSSPGNPVFLNEQTALMEYKSELEDENRTLNEQLLALQNPTAENDIAAIQNELNEKIAGIERNNSLSEEEKINAKRKVNTESIAALNKRFNELEEKLGSSPGNPVFLNEQTALMEYKSELEDENRELNKQLLAIQTATAEVELTKEDVLVSVSPGYSEEMEAITSNNSLSDLEKLAAAQALDDELLKALTKELTSTEKNLSKRPEDKKEKAKKELLVELIVQQESTIAERTQVINAKNQVSSVTDVAEVKSALLEEVSQNYLEERQSIENSSQTAYEKSLAIINLAVDQLERLVKKKAELEKALKRNPSDETLVAQKQAIDELITEQKNEIDALKQRAVGSISAEELAEKVASVDPNYSTDVNAIEAENRLTKGNDIAEREVVLQEKLEKAIEAKDNSLKRSYSVTVELEKAIFEKALEESKVREENARSTSDSAEKPNAIAQVRSSSETDISTALASNPKTKEELEKNDVILAEYELALKKRIVIVSKEISSNPSEELSNEKQLLEEELKQVQQKRRQFSASFGELETALVSSNNSNERNNEIAEEKQEILAKMNDPEVSTSEKKLLQKTLNSIENEQAEIENEQSELTLEESRKENDELITQLNSVESTNSTLAEKTTEVNEAEVANIEAIKEAAAAAKSEKEKQHLLQEAEERQSLLNSALKEIVTTQKQIDLEEKENISVTSREELEVQQRKFSIQIGELTTQIVATEKEIATAKKKEIPALETRKQQLINQRSLLEMQLATIEKRLAKEKQPLTPVVTAESLEQTISFNEERKVASSENYEPYYEVATKTLETEREIANLEAELSGEQKRVRSLLEMQLENEKVDEIQLSVAKIKIIEEKIDRLKIEHTQQKYEAEQLLSENTEEAMKMQNLVLRGVKPIQATVLATSLIAMPSTGFAIDEAAPSAYTAENPIPIDVESPSGLYYRVQIGAFAKPIPQDLFSEFTPVSGEKIEGSNIVRYMAGFFNNSSTVTDARSKIRSLGYSDAFIVAYCDGKRLNFADAKRLEEQGLCVPKGENELVLEVVTKTAEKLGLPMTKEVKEVPEVSYNQSPGAVEAEPIELKKGLFFTVQVGVYNRPIAAENVFGMDELITLRLPNGQIRYSSGVFNSVDAAKPRRTEALQKGVVGAFITAYYNGERISLAEAQRLLDEKGTAILQSEIEKNTTVVELEKPAKGTRTDSVSLENITTSVELNTQKIQLVSKERFEEFPRDELNRFNAEGNFYYDQTDKRLKSIVYNHEDDLPRLWNFKDVLDTVYLATDEVDLVDQQVLVVKTVGTSIPGDFMDWLNREPYQRAFRRNEEGVEITLSGIEPNRILAVQELIRTFGVSTEVRNAAEVEFEK